MKLTWHDVSARYNVKPAPSGLYLTQAIANSFAALPGRDADVLAELDTARAFLDELVQQWTITHQSADPRIRLGEEDLSRLRRFRTELRAMLRDDADSDLGFDTQIQISVRGRQADAVPLGTHADWLESAIGAELLFAAKETQLRRLKLCRNAACEVAFYDESKNSSRVWHDMAKCGTPQQMREYRARKRLAVDEQARGSQQ
jgi:predicted RNA-binding Zn ribbon-like protein